MNRLSRAGRKRIIKKVLQDYRKRDNEGGLTVGQIAKRMGLKSSTYLKNLLKEMSETDDEIIHSDNDGINRWKFKPYRQTSFFSRGITINGQLVAVNDFYDRLQSS